MRRRLEEYIKRSAHALASIYDEGVQVICLMCLAVLLFGLGIYLGALITVRHAERKDVLEARCLKALPELNRAAAGLEARAQEVIHEGMLLGNEVLQPGDQPGLQGMYKEKGGTGH